MTIELRMETESDHLETENMTREAFWDLFKPGCDEHLLLHQLRQSKAFVPELDYVACDEGRIVGNIVYTKALVKDGPRQSEVLCMGPLCVLPSCQGTGIGSALLRTTLEKARSLGYRAVILFGHPAYYREFGFSNAQAFGIKTAQGDNFEAFMALELYPGALQDVQGSFHEDGAFAIRKEDLEEFDVLFPPKEKHKREGQFL